MGRARQAMAAKRQTVTRAAPDGAGIGRGLSVSAAATNLAQLLRARAFCLAGDGPLIARVAANLESFGGHVDDDAAAWIGSGAAPEGRVALSLGPAAGALGPHSFGFINNLDGVAPLAAPLSPQDRPRRGHLAWVVPRRDALPEVAPLLFGRGLGMSWLISVGDGDPAEVLRFLALDPATRAILIAVGRGMRAQTLREALSEKTAVLLEPPSGAGKDSHLIRAVARRAGAVVTSQLEEWLAHAALLDAVAEGPPGRQGPAVPASRRQRAAVIVAGAGVDFVTSEVQKARGSQKAQLPLRAVDGEDATALDEALRQAGRDAEVVLLCGSGEVVDSAAAPGPLLRVDPAQPERLRALLHALTTPQALRDDKPQKSKADTARIEAVLADLPPPLYVGEAEVSDEVLGDHDVKRLLHAYGVRVSRQAPANTTTAALRILSKLSLPVELLPAVAPHADVERILGEETKAKVLCATQAEVKRQATLLLSHSPHVLLRETLRQAPLLRVQAGAERGLGLLLKLGRATATQAPLQAQIAVWEAALLPLRQAEAQRLCESLLGADTECDAKELVALLGGISTCLEAHTLTLDLVVLLGREPVVLHAAGVLKRQAAPAPRRK
jgi:hypothetical protein